jgi:6-phosphogluconolactonase
MSGRLRVATASSGILSLHLLSACGGGGDGAETNEVLAGKQTTYAISGAVTGLGTASLTLSNRDITRNSAETLTVLGTGATEVRFNFLTTLPAQTDFAVSVIAPFPANVGCSVVNASGRISSTAVSNVQVNCLPNTYNVSGTVTNLMGSGLRLRINGGETVDVSPGTNAPFTFSTALGSGTGYSVTVIQQPVTPSQICLQTASASGAPTGSNIDDVIINCLSKFGRFLYLSNTASSGSPPMWLFSIDPLTGALTPGPTPIVSTGQFVRSLLTHPSGRYAFSLANGWHVSSFSIGEAGQLTWLSTAFPSYIDTELPDQNTVSFLQTDPLGQYVFASGINVAPHTSGANVSGSIDRYSVGVVGQLSFALRSLSSGASVPQAATTPSGRHIAFVPLRAVHPSGAYSYVVNAIASTVTQFNVDGSGVLTPASTPVVAVGQGTSSISVSPNGQHAYTLSQTGAAIWQFSINETTGALSPISPATISTCAQPASFVMESSGRFAYVACATDSTLQQFSVGTDGGLSFVTTFSTPQSGTPGTISIAGPS